MKKSVEVWVFYRLYSVALPLPLKVSCYQCSLYTVAPPLPLTGSCYQCSPCTVAVNQLSIHHILTMKCKLNKVVWPPSTPNQPSLSHSIESFLTCHPFYVFDDHYKHTSTLSFWDSLWLCPPVLMLTWLVERSKSLRYSLNLPTV